MNKYTLKPRDGYYKIHTLYGKKSPVFYLFFFNISFFLLTDKLLKSFRKVIVTTMRKRHKLDNSYGGKTTTMLN